MSCSNILGNNIGHVGLKEIAKLFNEARTITSLDLNLQGEVFVLKRMKFLANNLTDKGLQKLSEAFESARLLEHLTLNLQRTTIPPKSLHTITSII